jgi:hypothetical protein
MNTEGMSSCFVAVPDWACNSGSISVVRHGAVDAVATSGKLYSFWAQPQASPLERPLISHCRPALRQSLQRPETRTFLPAASPTISSVILSQIRNSFVIAAIPLPPPTAQASIPRRFANLSFRCLREGSVRQDSHREQCASLVDRFDADRRRPIQTSRRCPGIVGQHALLRVAKADATKGGDSTKPEVFDPPRAGSRILKVVSRHRSRWRRPATSLKPR